MKTVRTSRNLFRFAILSSALWLSTGIAFGRTMPATTTTTTTAPGHSVQSIDSVNGMKSAIVIISATPHQPLLCGVAPEVNGKRVARPLSTSGTDERHAVMK